MAAKPELHVFEDGTEYFQVVLEFPRNLTADEATVLGNAFFVALNKDKLFHNPGVSTLSNSDHIRLSFSLDEDRLFRRAADSNRRQREAMDAEARLIDLGVSYVMPPVSP